jgi:hypothetical protein
MTNIDQFESAFKAAAKTIYEYQPVEIGKVLVVTDRDEAGAKAFAEEARAFLKVIPDAEWKEIPGSAFTSVGDLLDLVGNEKPDLVCTYRNLHSTSWKWPYTLGSHLTALTQDTPQPVLALPHPEAGRAADHALNDTSSVMAITDHLTGDHQLVNVALRFTRQKGTLHLTHVEDRVDFERFLDTISKIPSIDTDSAREEIALKLLQEPNDYIETCRRVLAERNAEVDIHATVTLGRRLAEYRKLIEQHGVDLLVFHTRDEDQLAMHGLAHPLAVELRHIPLLMI